MPLIGNPQALPQNNSRSRLSGSCRDWLGESASLRGADCGCVGAIRARDAARGLAGADRPPG
jgi:hypothetical protein